MMQDANQKALSITVTGKVQGVWFRASTQRQAIALGVTGWIRNQVDGSVYMQIYGPEASLAKLSSWCQAGGPEHAKVTNVHQESIPWSAHEQFLIKR